MRTNSFCAYLCLLVAVATAHAQSTSARRYLEQPADWYATDEAKRLASNILSFQSANGAWPKNVDTATRPSSRPASELDGTFDNSATTDEMRYLARMYNATKDARYSEAVVRALDYILKAQYANGGWPQYYPPGNSYNRYITFNDGAMGRLMFMLREVFTQDRYAFVDPARRQAAKAAFDRGVDCILKCQVRVNGKLTAWCAQHDEKDFTPKPARAFEPTSLSGCESVGLVHVLMSIEKPSPQIVEAVDAAVAWLDSVKIPGIKTEDIRRQDAQRQNDRIVVEDPSAPPMWARFYEIGTNKPIFGDRDGKVYDKLSDISQERRTGYRWLSYWPRDLIAKEYPEWKSKVSKN